VVKSDEKHVLDILRHSLYVNDIHVRGIIFTASDSLSFSEFLLVGVLILTKNLSRMS